MFTDVYSFMDLGALFLWVAHSEDTNYRLPNFAHTVRLSVHPTSLQSFTFSIALDF